MESDIAQWCAPWRRQQAGRRDSSSAWKAAESGPNPKKKIKQIESACRIFGQSYIKIDLRWHSSFTGNSPGQWRHRLSN